jgi:GMP reductase
MEKLINTARLAKKLYGDKMILMVGNVANPLTFKEYCDIGVNSVRIGIGNGGGCLTTVHTGIGHPMASLIESCYKIKKQLETERKIYNMSPLKTKIVADGGFKKYSDIIKALALGADFVMLGSIFNKSLESAGETIKHTSDNSIGMIVDQYSQEAKDMFNAEITLRKVFRGMSTKDVQKKWGKNDLVTSEGVVKSHKVEYTLSGWRKNFEDYLRSAMSYTGKKELHEFIGGVQYEMITQNAFKRFDK